MHHVFPKYVSTGGPDSYYAEMLGHTVQVTQRPVDTKLLQLRQDCKGARQQGHQQFHQVALLPTSGHALTIMSVHPASGTMSIVRVPTLLLCQ